MARTAHLFGVGACLAVTLLCLLASSTKARPTWAVVLKDKDSFVDRTLPRFRSHVRARMRSFVEVARRKSVTSTRADSNDQNEGGLRSGHDPMHRQVPVPAPLTEGSVPSDDLSHPPSIRYTHSCPSHHGRPPQQALVGRACCASFCGRPHGGRIPKRPSTCVRL